MTSRLPLQCTDMSATVTCWQWSSVMDVNGQIATRRCSTFICLNWISHIMMTTPQNSLSIIIITTCILIIIIVVITRICNKIFLASAWMLFIDRLQVPGWLWNVWKHRRSQGVQWVHLHPPRAVKKNFFRPNLQEKCVSAPPQDT